jgi:predicted RNase H-like nuclease
MSSERVLGVDACRAGWAGIVLSGGDPQAYVAPTIRELAEQASADGPLRAVAIDIPIGLADTGRRRADQLAREALGRRWPSLFSASRTPRRGG